jgi:hypothetical protein
VARGWQGKGGEIASADMESTSRFRSENGRQALGKMEEVEKQEREDVRRQGGSEGHWQNVGITYWTKWAVVSVEIAFRSYSIMASLCVATLILQNAVFSTIKKRKFAYRKIMIDKRSMERGACKLYIFAVY